MTETDKDNSTDQTKTAIGKVIELAKQGRKEILPTLRALLDTHPELWKHFGQMALHAQASWLSLIGGSNLYLKECLERNAAAQRKSLAGDDATPLEQLQIERVVALNLQLGYYEAQLARYECEASDKVREYLHDRCAAADRRLQQALMNLARIRKLLPGLLKVEVVVTGEVHTTAKEAHDTKEAVSPTSDRPVRLRVPKNRIKELLSAAAN